jgi:hypothetical protein
LLAYLLLRLVGWIAEWKHSFRCLYTLVKGMLWNRRNFTELIKSLDSPFGNKSSPPQVDEQLEFNFS